MQHQVSATWRQGGEQLGPPSRPDHCLYQRPLSPEGKDRAILITAVCQCLGEPGAQEGLWDLDAGERTIRDVIQ